VKPCGIDRAVRAAERHRKEWQAGYPLPAAVRESAQAGALHTNTRLLKRRERRLGAALSLVLHRTDDAHRCVIYRRSRQSRLHLNLLIKNGERVSLRGAFGAPRIYRVAVVACVAATMGVIALRGRRPPATRRRLAFPPATSGYRCRPTN
jgi:hypothetical protein